MLQPAENLERAIACAIADARRFAEDRRPYFGLLVLQQALALALREQDEGCEWAGEAAGQVEAEIRSYRVEYQVEEL